MKGYVKSPCPSLLVWRWYPVVQDWWSVYLKSLIAELLPVPTHRTAGARHHAQTGALRHISLGTGTVEQSVIHVDQTRTQLQLRWEKSGEESIDNLVVVWRGVWR